LSCASLDPIGLGAERWMNRWIPALNAAPAPSKDDPPHRSVSRSTSYRAMVREPELATLRTLLDRLGADADRA
jgi:hypothetical protein